MSPNKIIPSLKWGHSNTLAVDAFNFGLNPGKHKNAAQEMNLSPEPFMLMEVHLLLPELTVVLCTSPRAKQTWASH